MEKLTLKYVFLCLCPVLAGISAFLFVKFSKPFFLIPMIIFILIVRCNMSFYEQFEARGLTTSALKRAFGLRR